MNSMKAHLRHGSMAVALAFLTSACAFTPAEDVPFAARPDARPVRAVTSFSESLRCMDRLFAGFGVNNIVVTSQGIPDATGEIETGTKEMLISAISRMSLTSNAFTFVDFDQTQFDVNALQNLVGFTDEFIVPNYYIRGAITQLDEGVVAESFGGGFSLSQADAGASADQVYSLITVDTNVGDLLSRQIIRATSAGNSLAVRRRGFAIDGGAALENPTLGLNVTLNFNRSEGVHQAVRTLVELSTIESLGKLVQVPYWRCLGIEQTNSAVEEQARSWFSAMSLEEKTRFVQRALRGQGIYNDAVTGRMNAATRDSIGAYQAGAGLLADGRINFDLYASLISGDLALGAEPESDVVPAVYQPATTPSPQPLQLTLSTRNGDSSALRAGSNFELQLQPTTDAYAYCFYQDGKGAVSRIFPNRFQPNAKVAGGSFSIIPGPGVPFNIILEQPGAVEKVACAAARQEIAASSASVLQGEDLVPLRLNSLDEAMASFQGIENVYVTEARLAISVQP